MMFGVARCAGLFAPAAQSLPDRLESSGFELLPAMPGGARAGKERAAQ